MKLKLTISSIACAITVTGCASSINGFPDRAEKVDTTLTSLRSAYYLPSENVIATYQSKSTDAEKVKYRNEVVYGRLQALDIQYALFVRAIYSESIKSNLALDGLELGLDAAGAITTGADASRILSALSGGLSGAQSSIQKNLYFERTLPALLAVMNADRLRIKADIERSLTTNSTTYPLGRALNDLEEYYYAGSLPGAIASITEEAGIAEAEAKDEIRIVRDASIAAEAAQKSADRVLTLVDSLPEGEAAKLLSSPPTAIQGEVKSAVEASLAGRTLASAVADGLSDDEAKATLKLVTVLLPDRSATGLGLWLTAIASAAEGG